MNSLTQLAFLTLLFGSIICPPVDKNKEPEKPKSNEEAADDDFGLEYGRYLQQVVQALEEDKEFAKKLENISSEQIRNGQIAHELEFVKHNVRTKLDELKRIEIDRIRKLLQEQIDQSELGVYRDAEGRLVSSSDSGRRWRTIPGVQVDSYGNLFLALNRKGVKLPQHVDLDNVHSFEVGDLKKLIQTATKDLEELDRQRKEEFKKYELEKEYKYQESLKNLTEEERKDTVKHHQEMIQKHKDHPKVHHPGSKPQLEQVWEEEDHMPKDEFNPKTFFAMHDINGDGHLDENEIEALLMPEVRKMYDPKNEEDDPAEMEEEYHRMREHIFNETDNNKDGLISLEEFLKMTQQKEFEQDDGWQGLDEQTVYSQDELEEYMRQRHLAMQNQGMDPRLYYDVNYPPQGGMPPHGNYPQHGMPPQQQYHQPVYQQQGQQLHAVPPQQQHPQYQGVPPQHQQQFQGVPPHQQQFQGVPPQHQQQFQGVPPQHQQQFQGVPPQHQQQFQGVPPQHQQQFQGVPPQQQQFQGVPQQQHQGVPHQQQNVQPPVPQQPHQGVPPQQQNVQPPVPQQPNPGSQNVNAVNSPSANLPSSAVPKV